MTVQRICARHGRYIGSVCPTCKMERARRPKKQTPATIARSSRRWKRIERLAKERDEFRCTYGLMLGDRGAGHFPDGRCPVTAGLQGHHIIAIEDGGAPYDVENVRTVCATHHGRLESESRRERSRDEQEADV